LENVVWKYCVYRQYKYKFANFHGSERSHCGLLGGEPMY